MTNLQRDSSYFLELQTQTGWGAMLRSFATWLDPKPASLILDVGCGPGVPRHFRRKRMPRPRHRLILRYVP